MSPTLGEVYPPPHAGGAADEADADVWMGGLEAPGGGGGGGVRGGGAGRAGDDGRRNSLGLGQSENATLRKIEAQMEVREWRPAEVIMQ